MATSPSILPNKIPSTNVPFTQINQGGGYLITQMWYLFLYNIYLNTAYQPRHGFSTETNSSGFTASVSDIYNGAVETTLTLTGTLGAGANLQLPTVSALVTSIQNVAPGQTFKLRIINASGTSFIWTVTTNTGWTLTGTHTIAQNTWRDFYITLNSLTTATLQNIGTGTFS